jgi:hypothetical protein
MTGQAVTAPIEESPKRVMQVLLLGILLFVFSIELFWFARAQDIWIDESTQLSGVTLRFWDMLKWLMGQDVARFGVPGDRMPPISYLLDWSWLRLAGPSEFGFRMFHAGLVVAGALLLGTVARHEIGIEAAVILLLFFLLSPKLIQTAVEIRAYPVFFCITCMQLAMFLRLLPGSYCRDLTDLSIKRLLVFAGLCLLASYCHFYGIISTIAFFLALGAAYQRSWQSLVALGVTFICVMVGSSGLFPFVTSAIGQSSPSAMEEPTASQYLTYLLRLFGDSANMVQLPAAVLFLGGTSVLLAAAALAGIIRIVRLQATSCDWIIVVAGAGAAIPVLASLVITRFNAISPSYSGWLFVPLALLVAKGASSPTGFGLWDKAGRFVAMGAALIGGTASTLYFLSHAPMFIHGPQRFVSAVFDQVGDSKAIIHEGVGWGYAYFPIVFTHNGSIRQYRASNGQIRSIQSGSLSHDVMPAILNYNHLLLVIVHVRTYHDLRGCDGVRETCPIIPHSEIEDTLVATGKWRVSGIARSFGLYDTQVKILDRISDGCIDPSFDESQCKP